MNVEEYHRKIKELAPKIHNEKNLRYILTTMMASYDEEIRAKMEKGRGN